MHGVADHVEYADKPEPLRADPVERHAVERRIEIVDVGVRGKDQTGPGPVLEVGALHQEDAATVATARLVGGYVEGGCAAGLA